MEKQDEKHLDKEIQPEISVVIPVYGCPTALPELHERLTETLSHLCVDYEIILVNDACPMDSWLVIEQLAQSDSHVQGLNLSRNFGQIKAITAGLDRARGRWNVVMDCDLQDRPEEISSLYHKALEGYDVVLSRRMARQDKKGKMFLSYCFYKVYSLLSDSDYDPSLSNFSMISEQVRCSYTSLREMHRSYTIYLKWLGYRQSVIDVPHDPRFEGKSGYSLKRRIRMASDIITSSSDKLLRILFQAGGVISTLCFLALLGLLITSALHHSILWNSIMLCSIFLCTGLLMMACGILGIYIGSIFLQV